MKHIKTFETFNTQLHDLEKLNEGWKEWLAAGLITLGAVGGVYKLDKDSEEALQKKQDYAKELCKTLDKMDEKDVKGMIPVGYFSAGDSGSHWNDIEHYKGLGLKQDNYQDTLSTVKDVIKQNPSWFGITKDGKVTPLDSKGNPTTHIDMGI